MSSCLSFLLFLPSCLLGEGCLVWVYGVVVMIFVVSVYSLLLLLSCLCLSASGGGVVAPPCSIAFFCLVVLCLVLPRILPREFGLDPCLLVVG